MNAGKSTPANQHRPDMPTDQRRADERKRAADQEMDLELDRELADTFPASDPLPWSHEVK